MLNLVRDRWWWLMAGAVGLIGVYVYMGAFSTVTSDVNRPHAILGVVLVMLGLALATHPLLNLCERIAAGRVHELDELEDDLLSDEPDEESDA